MGRPTHSKTAEFHKLFAANEKQIVTNNKVVPPKSVIWQELIKSLTDKVSEKALYTAALRWWSDHRSVEVIDSQSHCNLSNASSDFDSSTNSVDQGHVIKFSIELSAKVWDSIKPVTKLYSRKTGNQSGVRPYEVLKPGVWSNVILDNVTKKRRDIPCAWVFETNKCSREGTNFIKLKARCNVCGSILTGLLEDEPESNEPILIRFEVTQLNRNLHDGEEPKSIKVGGEYVKEICAKKKPATTIRRSILKRKAALFVRPYGRVPTSNAIRCMKYRHRQKEKLSTCPFKSLSYLKASSKYMNTIHFVGNDPFACIYMSPNQVKLYKAYKQKNGWTKVSCDASASVANRLERPGGEKSGQIFFYTMVISDGFQVPVYSMLSEMNDANWITYWLSEWVRSTSNIPNQFTSDMSMALLNGGVRAFTSCASVSDYIELMFDLLLQTTANRQIPFCFIRIDIAHLMKNVTTCDALHNKPKKMRDFFIRCVALLVLITDINEARDHILSVLIVARSLTEGNSATSEPVLCEIHKKTLILKISGNGKEVEEAEQSAVLVEQSIFIDHFDDTLQGTNVSRWMDAISVEAAEAVATSDDGDRDNLMYNPQFVGYFADLCKLFPLWSAICCQFFTKSDKTASSGNVESHIKVMKQSMEDVIPCSVDKFVQENMDMVEGMIIDASQSYIKFISDTGELVFDSTNASTNLTELNEEQFFGARNLEERTATTDSTNEISSANEQVTESKEDESFDEGNLQQSTPTIDIGHKQSSVNCPACKDKNWPTGAHTCVSCNKNVHLLDGCSLSIGNREGHGEKRICVACDNQRTESTKSKISEMDHTENWCRKSKRQIKKSKYLMPVPNWTLNHHFNKNVKVGMLTNGNLSTRVFGGKNDLIALTNTCSFDVIAQIIAAAYAYIPLSRHTINNTHEPVFEIAIALAKNDNMNRVNNMRARLLKNVIGKEDVSGMITTMLKNSPSCKLHWKCAVCEAQYTVNMTYVLVTIRSDLSELNRVIASYLSGIQSSHHFCNTCAESMTFKEFEFKFLFFITLANERNGTLAEIPDVIDLCDEKYVLFGGILHLEAIMEGDTRHYVTAVKINETWTIFDDRKKQPYYVSSKKNFPIHTLLYTKRSDAESVNDGVRNNNVTNPSSLKRKAKNVGSDSTVVEKVKIFQQNGISNHNSIPTPVAMSSSKPKDTVGKISILSNGSSFMCNGRRVYIRNTCGFDSVAQIVAAGIALIEPYRKAFSGSGDGIFQIASMLATKTKINDMRSQLLLTLFGKTNNACVVAEVLTRTFKESPSALEMMTCSRDDCKFSMTLPRPYLSMEMGVFNNNMNNIERSISANLYALTNCRVCSNFSMEITREFGQHLFIEIPVSSLDPDNNGTEAIVTYKLNELKQCIRIDNIVYTLFGLILFQPPQNNHGDFGTLGHYVAAVIVDGSLHLFDDHRRCTYAVEPSTELVIHCLYYINVEWVGDLQPCDSSFDMSATSHSDESLYRLYHNIR